MPGGADMIRIAHEAGVPVAVLTGEEPSGSATAVLSVLQAIGGSADGYTITAPSRFVRPGATVVEILDTSAAQLYPEGTLLFCEPADRGVQGAVMVVDTGSELRLAKAVTAEDGRGITWLGLGLSARSAGHLPSIARPILKPYAALTFLTET